ncbi:hypothetical protein BGX23_001545 [Mortierella sp. AD031]|nr:hypothetical protein BGX23_001545 [Mortierella sp. AD031]
MQQQYGDNSAGEHGGIGVMDLMTSNLSQSSDFGPSPSQLNESVDYFKSYLNVYSTPSGPGSFSDSPSIAPRTAASDQLQHKMTINGTGGSQDLEDVSQQQATTTTTDFGSASPLCQYEGNGGGGSNGESPLGGPDFFQYSPHLFTNESSSSPTLSSSTAVVVASTASPSSSPPMAEVVESPEKIAFRRAEQNRAAQRAFRQRKQKYIKWLESKAEELDEVYRILALVRTENQQLCNLVMELDGKLSHNGSGSSTTTTKDLKRLSSHAVMVLTSSSSASDRDMAAITATAASSSESATNGGLDGAQAKSRTIRGIEGSLGREISKRLMNLATFPGLGSSVDQDAAMLRKLKYHPRSSNIGKSSSCSGGGGGSNGSSKSKTGLKISQHSKRLGTGVLHNALQTKSMCD